MYSVFINIPEYVYISNSAIDSILWIIQKQQLNCNIKVFFAVTASFFTFIFIRLCFHQPLPDDRSMQRVLKEVDTKDLSMALKGASEELQEKFFRNMSSRAAEMIREDMEYMGPIRLKDVEEVQQRIVDVIRRLEEDGEIIISGRGGEEDIVV